MTNAVTAPADKLAELQREAARYRWLTQHAYIGPCFTDQVESGVILEVGGCDRRVPDEVGEYTDVGAAIDAAIAAERALGVGSMDEARAKRILDALRAMQEMWDHLRRKGLNEVLMREYSAALRVLEEDLKVRLPDGGKVVDDDNH